MNNSRQFYTSILASCLICVSVYLIIQSILLSNTIKEKDVVIQSLQEKVENNKVYNAEYYDTKIKNLTKALIEIQTAYVEVNKIANDAVNRNIELLEAKIKSAKTP